MQQWSHLYFILDVVHWNLVVGHRKGRSWDILQLLWLVMFLNTFWLGDLIEDWAEVPWLLSQSCHRWLNGSTTWSELSIPWADIIFLCLIPPASSYLHRTLWIFFVYELQNYPSAIILFVRFTALKSIHYKGCSGEHYVWSSLYIQMHSMHRYFQCQEKLICAFSWPHGKQFSLSDSWLWLTEF